MGICDTFKTNFFEVNVQCYNSLGGTNKTFQIDDEVPTEKLDADFFPTANYGKNYNIFDLDTEQVVLVRDAKLKEIIPVPFLVDDYTSGYLCIDIYGNQIENIDSAKDYKIVSEIYSKDKQYKNQRLEDLRKTLSTEYVGQKNTSSIRKKITETIKGLFI